MKKIMIVTAAALLAAGLSSGAASAKHRHHHHRHYHHAYNGETMAPAPGPFFGNNAELMGNNGNSASGDNSLGHIKGGNVGAGE